MDTDEPESESQAISHSPWGPHSPASSSFMAQGAGPQGGHGLLPDWADGSAVVITAGQDHERGSIQPVDEAMHRIDAA